MAARRNPFVKTGRPPAPTSAAGVARPKRASGAMGAPSGIPPMVGASAPGPMDGFSGSMPGAAFRLGGTVRGHKMMPSHGVECRAVGGFAGKVEHTKRLSRGGKS